MFRSVFDGKGHPFCYSSWRIWTYVRQRIISGGIVQILKGFKKRHPPHLVGIMDTSDHFVKKGE